MYMNEATEFMTQNDVKLWSPIKCCCSALKILVENADDNLLVLQLHGLPVLHEVCTRTLYKLVCTVAIVDRNSI